MVVLTAPWFAAVAGFMAGLQPAGVEWRWFSFHPLLMTLGFVGMMVGASVMHIHNISAKSNCYHDHYDKQSNNKVDLSHFVVYIDLRQME